MPLVPETTISAPNALYVPQILLHTAIVGGQLKTCAQIVLRGATVDESGNWADAAGSSVVQLADLANLPADIAAASDAIATAYAKIVEAIGVVNGVRKLL